MPETKRNPPPPVIFTHTGLRGIAAMAVLLAHLNAYSIAGVFDQDIYVALFYWHSFAVDLFFVLSGFILHWVYVDRGPQVSWKAFATARVARIAPLYYLTLLVLLPRPLCGLLSHGTVQTGQHYALTLATNLLGVSGILYGWQGTMNQTAWSIGVEVFCYILVFPFLAHWSKKTSLSLWSLLALAAFLDFLMGTCYAQATFYAPARGWNSLWLVRGIFGFTAGFLTCGAFRRAAGLKISTSWINLTLLAAGVIFVLSRLGVLPDYAMIYLFPPVVFLTAYDRGVVAWLMERPVFQWLGERSYSIYLWQYPAAGFYLLVFNRIILREPTYTPHQGGFGVLSFTMAVAFVLGIAELSYRYFETPCREKIRRWGQVKKSGPEEWKLPPTHAADLRSEPQLP